MGTRQTYYWNNITLSPAQLAQVYYAAGFRGENLVKMVGISLRESGGRAGVHGSESAQSRVTGDRGIAQINGTWDNTLRNAGIIRNSADLFDPLTNAKAAYYLSGGGTNFSPWNAAAGGFNSGGSPLYNVNLQRAAQGVQQAASSGMLTGRYTGPSYNSATGTTNGGSGEGDAGGSQTGAGGGGMGSTYNPNNPNNGGSGGGSYPTGTGTTGTGTGYIYDPTVADLYTSIYNNLTAQAGVQQGYADLTNSYLRNQRSATSAINDLQQRGIGLDQASLDIENRYQADINALDAHLNANQKKQLKKQWDQLALNVAKLKELNTQGYGNTKDYLKKSLQLERDISTQVKKYIGERKDLTEADYQTTLNKIKNVLTTASERYAETVRGVGVERLLANETLSQARKESAFTRREQVRSATSDATSRGAMSSEGFGQNLNAYQQQESLANSAANITYRKTLEGIQQALNSGKITMAEAQRAATDAKAEAYNTRAKELASLRNEGAEESLRMRGVNNTFQYNWRDAYLNYVKEAEAQRYRKASGYISYINDLNALNTAGQKITAGEALRTATYPIAQQKLANQGSILGYQNTQDMNTAQYNMDQTNYTLASNLANIASQQTAAGAKQIGSIGSYITPGTTSIGRGSGSSTGTLTGNRPPATTTGKLTQYAN